MHAPILVFSTDANETLHFDEDEILELAKIQVPSADYATEEDHTAFNGVEELFYEKGSYKNSVGRSRRRKNTGITPPARRLLLQIRANNINHFKTQILSQKLRKSVD